MRCPNCKAENDHASQLCKECGTRLSIICPKCANENHPKNKFCSECGVNLASLSEANLPYIAFEEKLKRIQRYLPKGVAQKVLEQKDKIEGEIKQVTVMFCDLVGFTPLVESIGLEDAYSIMGKVYEILIHMVHRYDGTVNEMTGDGIMALFGAPIALEDAPQRALWSALAIHRELERFNKQYKVVMHLQMRIGIHTGPVVVGTLGNDLRVEFKAVGDTVNMAARMESIAEPGTCYVTEDTYRQTKELFQFDPIGKKILKGKSKTVPVYKISSSKEDGYRARLGSERMIYSEMIGRDHELRKLELQVMKAINGEGSVVNIIGEAGIGKSRLIAELKKHDVMKHVVALEGRAISIGRKLGFHPIIDLLKKWAKIRFDDGEAASFYKLEKAVRNICPEDYYEILPFVGILMGMKLSGSYMERIEGIEGKALEQMIQKSIRDLLKRATEMIPLVIIFEDMHWADTTSIELLESIYRLAESQRILFINLIRSGYEETGDRIIQAIKEKLDVYHIELVLEPLDEAKSETLITNMLNTAGIRHILIKKIVNRSSGNPFFIEEVVRSLLDEQVVVLKDGIFHITDKIEQINIPNTINDVLMSRVDLLEEKTRNLVRIASVIGRNFYHRILSEVAVSIEDMDKRLSYLKEIQLLRENKRKGEVEYIFKHGLTQEAVYESILPRKRKELHLGVAKAIEKVYRQRIHEFYGMLAYHFSKAGNQEKTEDYLIKAGEEALKSSASSEALHYYEEVLKLYLNTCVDTANPDKVAKLEKNIALALYDRGQYAEAIEYFEKALSHYIRQKSRNGIYEIFRLSSSLLSILMTLYLPSIKIKKTPNKRETEIINLSYKKCKALGIISPKKFFIESLVTHKKVNHFDIDKLELGSQIFMGASALFSFSGLSFRISKRILNISSNKFSRDNPKIRINYDFLETLHNYFSGNWKEINEYDDNLVNKNLRLGETYDASQHYYWHACPYIYKGLFNDANCLAEKLEDIALTYGNDLSLMLKYFLRTNLLMEYRKLKEALDEIEEGLNFAKKTELEITLIDIFSCKAWIHILLGDIREAEKALRDADRVQSGIDTVPTQVCNFYRSQFGFFLHMLVESINKGDKSEYNKNRKNAIKSGRLLVLTTQKAAFHRTEAYKMMGTYFWLVNNQKKALSWWNKATNEGVRLGARLELSRAYFEIGKRLYEKSSNYKSLNGIKAEEYLTKAEVLFKKLDLQWDLDRLSSIRQC